MQALRAGLAGPYNLAVVIWQTSAPLRSAAVSVASSSSSGQVHEGVDLLSAFSLSYRTRRAGCHTPPPPPLSGSMVQAA